MHTLDLQWDVGLLFYPGHYSQVWVHLYTLNFQRGMGLFLYPKHHPRVDALVGFLPQDQSGMGDPTSSIVLQPA